jgi:hypothetical protein
MQAGEPDAEVKRTFPMKPYRDERYA